MIRELRASDYSQIDRIYIQHHRNDFAIPDLTNVITRAVIEKNDKVIAFGMVKLFAEAILVLDLNESKRDKIQAIQELMIEAIRGSKQYNLSQLHTFIQDENFANQMKKHYNFEKCVGEALVLQL